ncbi:hypothetical protein [Variovorax guangxiensis]|uniref:hypothetical protein n=1 Tax=Variovorax guangxiensis TaxID=1775474 RepID=UPI0028612F5F|nr:hypothetical protein [Variovorax guangxiensis]MDR6857875.1 hypothetical protein [Variovorax guangxiensis]
MASTNPLVTPPTSVTRVPVRERFGAVADGTLAFMLSPWRLGRFAIYPRTTRDRVVAILALGLAGALGLWVMSPSGIVATALAIALKWDLLRGILYAAGMYFSTAFRLAVGVVVFLVISSICLYGITRTGQSREHG